MRLQYFVTKADSGEQVLIPGGPKLLMLADEGAQEILGAYLF